MAWIPMYLLEKDLDFLNDWLNQEDEIAFLISQGPKKWIAMDEHRIATDIGTQKFSAGDDFPLPNYAEYNLWHIPSGPLPLLNAGISLEIENPNLGWTEITTGYNSRIPYFGAGHPGVIHLEIKLPDDNEIRMSNFGWIGNHYKISGNGADPSTEKFWNRLRRMVKNIGTQIPRCNDPNGKKEIYAFPAANEEIKNGQACALNP